MLKVNSFENAKKLFYMNGWKIQKSKIKSQKLGEFVSRKDAKKKRKDAKGNFLCAFAFLLCVFA
jgi:hypothetical protein